MKTQLIILYVLVLSLGGVLAWHLYSKPQQAVYIDTIQVFDGFEMKKEMEKKLQKSSEARKQALDSLLQQIRGAETARGEKDQELVALKQQYLYRKENLEAENAREMQDYNAQIWNQINQYTKEFGEKGQYELILGANGQGSLMYGTPDNDKTKELTEFVNTKYRGHEK